ncbi:hypothetical protein DY000_02037442 [Brassica cretica]|uniref:Uncharacterized protein n=1 Tax=Brassica cretica TaxID=69181 RepID=A0ABQ7B9K3_BRACR|nr:hypothetical protein DY000_02037442 [Brassica cretica]
MSWRQRNMKVLARQHEERGYRFRWRGLIVGTAGVYPRFLLIAFDLLNVKVRLILVGFCQRRPGILKTHCFGLVAGDKCHDIADHFSYAGSGCHSFDLRTRMFLNQQFHIAYWQARQIGRWHW